MEEKMPFIYGKSADFTNFTDRETENKRLQQNFISLINTTLVSPRRWGKTSLVENVAEELMRKDDKIKVCLLDIFNIRSEAEFYEYFAKSVLKATSNKWEEMFDNARTFLSQLIPRLTYSPAHQEEISFGVEWKEIEKSSETILDLPEMIAKQKKIKVIVCIDEFQAIGDFAEPLAFQRKLRSHWQHHHSVAYCLYGSKRHFLLDIFSNASMPFYKFGDIMFLEKISNRHWGEFVKKRFEDTHKKITIEQAEYLAELVENHSYYVQQLAQQTWLRTKRSCTMDIIDNSLESIKNQLSLLFVGQIEAMTTTQINFLKAVICGETLFSAQEVLKKYNLGTSANILRIKNALLQREIIDIQSNKVEILDPIFKFWLKKDYFRISILSKTK